MATTTVCDFVIWTKHVHDDDGVGERILALKAGETLDLVVDGVRGKWRKMDDGKDGRQTRGIRPLGIAQDIWRSLFETRRGEVVTLELAAAGSRAPRAPELLSQPLARTEHERHAALDALLNPGDRRWSSDGPYGARDELYDRE